MQMTQRYLPVHKKESENFSKIWYKKVHATTCTPVYQCTEIQNNGGHTSHQMEIAPKKLQDA